LRRLANVWRPLTSIPPGGADAGAWTRLADALTYSSNRVVEVIDTAASSQLAR
jgi:hypothetical protein